MLMGSAGSAWRATASHSSVQHRPGRTRGGVGGSAAHDGALPSTPLPRTRQCASLAPLHPHSLPLGTCDDGQVACKDSEEVVHGRAPHLRKADKRGREGASVGLGVCGAQGRRRIRGSRHGGPHTQRGAIPSACCLPTPSPSHQDRVEDEVTQPQLDGLGKPQG